MMYRLTPAWACISVYTVQHTQTPWTTSLTLIHWWFCTVSRLRLHGEPCWRFPCKRGWQRCWPGGTGITVDGATDKVSLNNATGVNHVTLVVLVTLCCILHEDTSIPHTHTFYFIFLLNLYLWRGVSPLFQESLARNTGETKKQGTKQERHNVCVAFSVSPIR